MSLTDRILEASPGAPENLDPWFEEKLASHIKAGLYPTESKVNEAAEKICQFLKEYGAKHNMSDVAIGMSGGIDSALTASLFKQAGWTVHGATLPIHQKQEETERGIEAIDFLRLEPYSFDLTKQYEAMSDFLAETETDHSSLVRQGNIRARLRMITLYNLAHKVGGCVGSTDNFSELAAGFWTLHGDVGDIAPIQSLSKSWEVPAMAAHMGVPDKTLKAMPTDGLGISTSDNDQLGCSYLEFDIVLFELLKKGKLTRVPKALKAKVEGVVNRVKSTAYKRSNPLNLDHPFDKKRFTLLEKFDKSQ